MAIAFSIIESEPDFFGLKSAWEELEKVTGSSSASMSFRWCSTWWRIFRDIENNSLGYKKKLAIICGYEKDQLILVVPLIRLQRRIGPLKINFLEFLGQQWGSIFCTALKTYDFKLSDLEAFLKKNIPYHILFLRQIPIRESKNYSDRLIPYSGLPFVNLKGYHTKDDFVLDNYSKKLKQNLRTSVNRIRKKNLSLTMAAVQIDNENFNEIIRISKSKFKDNKSSIYLDKNKLHFCRELFSVMDSNVVFVKINDINVAYRANIIYQNQKICIDASYDRNYRNYDPGIISIDYNFADTFTNNLEVDNLGPGLDDYKLKFTDTIEYVGYFFSQGSITGSAVLTFVFKQFLKKKYSEIILNDSKHE